MMEQDAGRRVESAPTHLAQVRSKCPVIKIQVHYMLMCPHLFQGVNLVERRIEEWELFLEPKSGFKILPSYFERGKHCL